MDSGNEALKAVVDRLRGCRSILFITGAGLSADSGLPTYRGIGGLYQRENTEDGIPIEQALSGAMMQRRPQIAWKHLARIIESCRSARYNRGHAVIAEMEAHFERVWTLTQNVDGFHRDAGTRNLIDIHGDIHGLLCTACGKRRRLEELTDLPIPPRCAACGAVLRPDVVLFGEMLPENKLDMLERQLRRGFDVIFSVGTTSVFPYIAAPVWQAQHCDTLTVEINPGHSEVSHLVDIRFAQGAAATLEAIWSAYKGKT
ncbi:MAG: NAD-dependent protein deacylase [Sedimentisphaerales bacterium]|nr:NAD-dependent protein deacylase [Sedimentisphaerales bacterium]